MIKTLKATDNKVWQFWQIKLPKTKDFSNYSITNISDAKVLEYATNTDSKLITIERIIQISHLLDDAEYKLDVCTTVDFIQNPNKTIELNNFSSYVIINNKRVYSHANLTITSSNEDGTKLLANIHINLPVMFVGKNNKIVRSNKFDFTVELEYDLQTEGQN